MKNSTPSFDLERRVVYHDPRFHAAFPSVARLADGTILVAFRRAPDHRWLLDDRARARFPMVDHVDPRSHLMLQRFNGQFEPLGDPSAIPADPEAGDQDPSLLALRDGRLLLGSFAWYPVPTRYARALKARGVNLLGDRTKTGVFYIFWGAGTRISEDGGRSWSQRRDLPDIPGFPELVPGRRGLPGGALRGRPVELADGTLLLTCYGGIPYQSFLFASIDGGQSWTLRSTIARDPENVVGFCETGLCKLADGRLLAIHRTTGLEGLLAISVSRDDGMSWDRWQVVNVFGHPTDMCRLPDGRYVVVYGYRAEPFGVRARIWDAEGADVASLATAPELILRDDSKTPDVGYPWSVVLEDGRIAVCHYQVDHAGIRHIQASLIGL